MNKYPKAGQPDLEKSTKADWVVIKWSPHFGEHVTHRFLVDQLAFSLVWIKLPYFTGGGKQTLDLIPWLQGTQLQSSSDQCGRKRLHPLYGWPVMSPSCTPLPSMPGSPAWPHGVGHRLFNPFPGQMDGRTDGRTDGQMLPSCC